MVEKNKSQENLKTENKEKQKTIVKHKTKWLACSSPSPSFLLPHTLPSRITSLSSLTGSLQSGGCPSTAPRAVRGVGATICTLLITGQQPGKNRR